jgi:predicted amidohydrolase YtcJ
MYLIPFMAGFDDEKMGNLEPGGKANFVIPDRDLIEMPYSEIPKIKVLKPIYNWSYR